MIACCGGDVNSGTLVLVGGDHPVADLGVTAYSREVTAEVLAAGNLGESLGVTAARTADLNWIVIGAGSSIGDLVETNAMEVEQVDRLLADGRALGTRLAVNGLVLLGEVGIGNTTVAAALACLLLHADPDDVVGLGAGADSAMLERKRTVVAEAIARARPLIEHVPVNDLPRALLAVVGGPEIAFLIGITLGVASAGGTVVLDGTVTSVAAMLACRHEPATGVHLIAGQQSREIGHPLVLHDLGLTPLLDLRLRAGEGVGAVLATRLILDVITTRRRVARVRD